VLLGTDEIDELVFSGIGDYEGMQFKNVQQIDAEEELGKSKSEHEAQGKKAVAILKKILGDRVKDVRISKRLGKSPSCVVFDKDDPTPAFRALMERITNEPVPESKPILEINPAHALIDRLVALDTRKDLSADNREVVQELEDLAFMIFYEQCLQRASTLKCPKTLAIGSIGCLHARVDGRWRIMSGSLPSLHHLVRAI